jgi:ribosomal-protein-alanine acetyltransferase
VIRTLRCRDIWSVLEVEWLAFPEDPWTTATAGGWPAKILDHHRRAAVAARLVRWTRMTAAVSAARLLGLVLFGRPRGLRYVVAETGPGVAGYGCIKTTGSEGDIESLAVRPERRHQGLGNALLGELVDRARCGGCRSVTLYVRADNAGARRLYERRGFSQADVIGGYYRPSGTDAIVMRLDLT